MTSKLSIVVATAFILGLSPMAMAQTAGQPLPELKMCDPLLATSVDQGDDGGQDPIRQTRLHRYDLEKSDTLTSEQAIMDALYEETWDLATGNPLERPSLCENEPSYVVNWAEIISQDEQGAIITPAKGLFQLSKDGSFKFVYNKRPYLGTWKVTDLKMTLQADWLNQGQPVTAPVEHVITPVEITYSDGAKDSYDEEVYRIGMFRLMPLKTTVKGIVQDCTCVAE
jgi:hypothetical protein